MRRVPSFPLLRAFDAAARSQSFSLAAEELHLTPSAVSHQIRELEEFLDCALFTRLHRRVELTAEGVVFARRIAGVFDTIADACREVGRAKEVETLAVHCAPSFAAKWLGRRLRAFADAHPEITLSVSSTAEPADLIRDRVSDVAISYGRAVQREGLTVNALGDEEIAVLCAPSLRDGFADARALLARAPLIGSPYNLMSWEDWFAARGLPSPEGRRLTFDRAAMGIDAAAEGMGVVLQTVRLAEDELASGALVRIDAGGPALMRPAHFFSVRTADCGEAKVRAFAAWLYGVAGLPLPSAFSPG